MLLDRSGPIADAWTRVGPGEALPQSGLAIVELDRLAEARGTALTLGLHIPNDTDPRALVGDFDRLALISVDFPSFADGRGFSIARCLRQIGYEGRLRATGPVIADQFTYLLQVGFDEVAVPLELAARQPAEQWIAQRAHVTLGYQRGVPGRGAILDRRHGDG